MGNIPDYGEPLKASIPAPDDEPRPELPSLESIFEVEAARRYLMFVHRQSRTPRRSKLSL